MSEPRVLLYDLETAPNLGYTWGVYDQRVLKVVRPWYILSCAWKWAGQKTVHVAGLDDYTLGPENDKHLVEDIWNLFDEADVVVAHNGNKFDQPKARARMAVHHLPPHSPIIEVDTYKLAKRHFKFDSNRLADLAVQLGCELKGSPGGFETWEGCMAGDPAAWALMKRYNRQDVVVLDAVWHQLRPWADNLPNFSVIGDRPKACPKCLSEEGLIIRGYKHYAYSRRATYQCKACGGYSVGRELEKTDVAYR